MCTCITFAYGSFLYLTAVSDLFQHEEEFKILAQLLLRYGPFVLPGGGSAALHSLTPYTATGLSSVTSHHGRLTERSHRSCLRSFSVGPTQRRSEVAFIYSHLLCVRFVLHLNLPLTSQSVRCWAVPVSYGPFSPAVSSWDTGKCADDLPHYIYHCHMFIYDSFS